MMMKIRQRARGMSSKQVIKILFVGLALLLCWYIVSRFVRIISGPSIITYTATSIDEEYPGFLKLQGITKNVKTFLINDYPVVPAVDGGFEYTFIAQPGYSVIEFQAFDKFDNHVTETLTLYTDEPPDNNRITPTSQPEDTDVESEESQETNNN